MDEDTLGLLYAIGMMVSVGLMWVFLIISNITMWWICLGIWSACFVGWIYTLIKLHMHKKKEV